MTVTVKIYIEDLTEQQLKKMYAEAMEDAKIQLDILSQCAGTKMCFTDAPNLCFTDSHKYFNQSVSHLNNIIDELKRRKIVKYPKGHRSSVTKSKGKKK